MDENTDIKQRLLDMIRHLDPAQVAELNHAVRDALVSAANGQPSRYPVNELVDIPQAEARRICRKIGLDWNTGKMSPDDS